MSEMWGKQRGYEKPNGYAKKYEQEKPYGCYGMKYEQEKSYGDYGMKCEHEKPCDQEKCRPPRICEIEKCEFCGFVWRKCHHCGKCVCCKVFRCDDAFIFICSECGEVFKVVCEEECCRK